MPARAGSWTARRTRPSRAPSTAARPRSSSTTATAPMYNLTPEALDPRARLVQGRKPFSMVEAAADAAFDVALFVGYHARAGHPTGHHRPHLHGPAHADHARLADRSGSTASTASTWAPWACPWAWSRATTRSPTRSPSGCRGRSGSWSSGVVSWRAADSVHPSVARRTGRRPRPGEPSSAPRPGRAGAARAARAHRASASTSGTPARPTSRRSSRASAGRATGACATTASDGIEAYRAFVAAVRIAGLADD